VARRARGPKRYGATLVSEFQPGTAIQDRMVRLVIARSAQPDSSAGIKLCGALKILPYPVRTPDAVKWVVRLRSAQGVRRRAVASRIVDTSWISHAVQRDRTPPVSREGAPLSCSGPATHCLTPHQPPLPPLLSAIFPDSTNINSRRCVPSLA